MTAAEKPTCVARVSEPPHYFHSHTCGKPAKAEVLPGVHVCGVHKRVAAKWQEQGRLAVMVQHWWRVRPDAAA